MALQLTLYRLVSYTSPLIYSIFGFFNSKVKKINRGRRSTYSDVSIWQKTISENDKIYWFHAASLGEFEQLIPVIRRLKQTSSTQIIVSFFSPSGYENAHDKYFDLKIYLPVDTVKSMQTLIQAIKPSKIIFCKYDIWPNFILEAAKLKIPLLLCGLEINESHFAIAKPYSLRASLLHRFSYLLTNTEDGARLLAKAGYPQALFTGSPKIEQAGTISNEDYENIQIKQFCDDHFIVIGGSAWEPEIHLLMKILSDYQDIKLIIAPHETDEPTIQSIHNKFGDLAIRLSQYSDTYIYKKVLIIDSIGKLKYLYRYSNIALIGGGFGPGIHNILEAAAYGIPIISGPNYLKFSEAIQLKKLNAFYPINAYDELKQIVNQYLSDENIVVKTKKVLGQYFKKNKFASAAIQKYIEE